MNNTLKRIFHITTTNSNDTDKQVLSVRAGEKHFAFSISRVNSDELLQMTWYTADEIDDNLLREIYLAEESLHQPFYKTVICYDYTEAVLVPEKYYSEGDTKNMLDLLYGKNIGGYIASASVPGQQIKTAYAIPASVQNWISGHFPAASHYHGYGIAMKQVNGMDVQGCMLVDFRTEDFLLVASRGHEFLFAQNFSYSAPADVIYHLLHAAKEFSFSQETVSIVVSGLIEKQSALYKELHQYFLQIRFREAGWSLRDVEGQDYPSHFFTSFNDVAVCAL